MRGICIATNRQADEPIYIELYRRADTGEPYLLYKDLESDTPERQEAITSQEAGEIMRAWGYTEADIKEEF